MKLADRQPAHIFAFSDHCVLLVEYADPFRKLCGYAGSLRKVNFSPATTYNSPGSIYVPVFMRWVRDFTRIASSENQSDGA
jgi:hypothetical protein